MGRVEAFDAGSDGISIKFFKEQAEKAATLRGGEAPEAPTGINWSGKSILWVDDIPENNFHEATMFEALGADVRFARNNRDAVQAARERAPTLIVSDISRDGEAETGLDLPSVFQSNGLRLPPLVYYTGSKDSDRTPSGHPVTVVPSELFSAVIRALENGEK